MLASTIYCFAYAFFLCSPAKPSYLPLVPTPLFNATTGKIFAELAVKARAENRKELDRLRRSAAALVDPDSEPADSLAAEIMKAMFAVLKGFEKRKPKEMAMCAQALRNLRESYHLVVCAPRPGQTRPWMRRPAPGSVSAGLALTIPEVIPPTGAPLEPPACGVDAPTGSVPPGSHEPPTPQVAQQSDNGAVGEPPK